MVDLFLAKEGEDGTAKLFQLKGFIQVGVNAAGDQITLMAIFSGEIIDQSYHIAPHGHRHLIKPVEQDEQLLVFIQETGVKNRRQLFQLMLG